MEDTNLENIKGTFENNIENHKDTHQKRRLSFDNSDQ